MTRRTELYDMAEVIDLFVRIGLNRGMRSHEIEYMTYRAWWADESSKVVDDNASWAFQLQCVPFGTGTGIVGYRTSDHHSFAQFTWAPVTNTQSAYAAYRSDTRTDPFGLLEECIREVAHQGQYGIRPGARRTNG